ncbi:S41 family peptidase [Singulisphaera sp. PoT]|uniref:S41 family peptidase n=1 Tax=Singulisphaera sp. PoT TaxID=3411797 RepID=UPI003BF4F159
MLEAQMFFGSKLLRGLLFGALLILPAMPEARAEEPDRAIDASERTAVIDGVTEKVRKVYVLPDVAEQMGKAIHVRQARGEYDNLATCQALAKTLTHDLREVCKDKHLEVQFFAKGIPYDSEKTPDPKEVAEFREAGRRRNYEFRKVEMLEGGIGLLRVDGFYPAEWITETAAGAMSFLANSEAIILDLRQNGGGQSGGTLLCSYFFAQPTHMTDFFNRADGSTQQVWSYPVAGAEKFASKDLYILTSRRTFSAPEGLAYDMQALKRATIVGETTGGGAHGTTIYRINDHFSASIPFCRSINPVTKSDHEGAGVKPDVAVSAEAALHTAHLLALRKLLEKYAEQPKVADGLKQVIAAKEKELEVLKMAK